jgi:segregation and condensation protein B
MSDDYSTPTSPESASAGWVKGNLPQEQGKEKEREPVQKPGFLRSTPEAERSGAEKPGFSLPSQNGALTLGALVESLLFVADGPVPVARIAEALEVTPREVEAALTTLGEAYATAHRGLSLQRFRDKVQLTTAPAAASAVERFLGLAATAPLSRAALETLAIVAYQQPVTRPQIESVRGVNSDSVLKTLLSKGLIEEVGRTEGPGRPVLYATTPEFLQYFGLSALTDLPPLSLDQPPTLPEPEADAPDEILKE